MTYYVHKQIGGLIYLSKNCTYSSNLKSESDNLLNSSINHSIFTGKNEFKRKLKLFIWILFASVMMNTVYAAVSPVTSKRYIRGTEPKLVFLSDDKTEVTNDNISQLTSILVPDPDDSSKKKKLSGAFIDQPYFHDVDVDQIEVSASVPMDNEYHPLPVKLVDPDGDVDDTDNIILPAKIRVGGYKYYGSKKITRCSGMLTVNVEIPGFNFKSKYPTSEGPQTIIKHAGSYYLYQPKICQFAPYDNTMVYSDDLGGWGINPAKWQVLNYLDTRNGVFKYDSGFPTTGFKGAKFNVIPNHINIGFRCSSKDNGGKIKLSSEKLLSQVNATNNMDSTPVENCTVTYNSETLSEFTAGGTPTIILEYEYRYWDQNGVYRKEWREGDRYTIPTPKKWGIYKGVASYGDKVSLDTSTQFPALDLCRGVPLGTTTSQQATGQGTTDKMFRQQFMYRREELANTKFSNPINYPEGSAWSRENNSVIRDIDNTFLDEWGQLEGYLKPKGPNPEIWTAESYSSRYQATALIWWGDSKYHKRLISDRSPGYDSGVAFCRGE